MDGRKTTFSTPEVESNKQKSIKMGRSESVTSFLGVLYDQDDRPDFRDPSNRKTYTVVVFTIITLQLLITAGCTIPFAMMEEAKSMVLENSWIIFVFLVIFVVPYFMLVCCGSTRREFPTNIVLLLFLTLGMAGTCACCTAWFETIVILYTLILTIIVVIGIIIIALAFPTKFTGWRSIFGTMLVFLVIFVSAAIIISIVTEYPLKTFIYPGIIISLFSAFLLHDIKSIMGGHRYAHITPDCYILGVAQVFADVIGLFITFLEIVGSITEDD